MGQICTKGQSFTKTILHNLSHRVTVLHGGSFLLESKIWKKNSYKKKQKNLKDNKK